MATWKKILREDYAVGVTDGLLELNSAVSGTTIDISLEDNRASTSEGSGKETVTLNAGSGISFSSNNTIGLTNTGITVSDGAGSGTNATLNLGGTLTIQGGGDVTVTNSGTTFTVSYTAAAQQAVGYTFSDGTTSEAITATNGNPLIVWDGGTYVDVGYTAASNTFLIDLNPAYNHFTVTNGTTPSDITLGGTLTIQAGTNTTVAQSGGTFTISSTQQNAFSSVAVSGQTTVVADGASDTLTLVAGTAIGITTDAGTADSVTINHANVTHTGSTATANVAIGGTLPAVSGITVNSQGHVTASTVTTYTIQAPQVTATDANSTFYLLLQAATGNLDAKIDNATTAGPTYNPNTATLTVANLTVNGTQTILDTTHLSIEDKTITIAAGAATAAAADGSALVVGVGDNGQSETNVANLPKVKWKNASELSGWVVADYNGGSAVVDKHVSTMQFATTASAPTAVDRGDFRYDTTTDILYVCIGN